MLQGRVLCKISLLIILIISISAYTPWDFLGVYDKAEAAGTFLNEGKRISAEGYVYHKEIKQDKVLYYVKNASVKTGSGTLSKTSFIFKSDSDKIPNFCKLNIDGTVKHFQKARNAGAFDMESYYQSKGLYFQLEEIGAYSFNCNAVVKADIFYRLRKAVSSVYEQTLSGEEPGFLSSVVMGDRSELDENLKTIFSDMGIAHILAVSGLHVSVICMALYKLLRKGGLGFILGGIIAGTVAVSYGILTGGSVSAIRAIGMFLIYLFSQIVGESYDLSTAMAVLADFLLIENPLYIKDSSFIFSFGAVLAIFYVAIPLSDMGQTCIKNKMLNYLSKSLLFSTGIFVGMLPIVTEMYNQTPLYSVVLNIVLLPMMPILLITGLLGGIIGLFCMPAARIILLICHLIIYFYEFISSLVSRLPFATVIVGHHTMIAVIVYYVILLAVVSLRRKRKKNRWSKFFKYMVIVFTMTIWLLPSKGSFEIDILDVGQGDGIYINSGEGTRFFIDGGSSSVDELGKYTLLPFLKYKGATSIDYWFISHCDLDHISGLLELLEAGYPVDNIVLSSQIPEGENLEMVLDLAGDNGTNIIYMNKGDACKTNKLSFTCLYPGADVITEDPNELSLCLLMEYTGSEKYSAFFGGDISAEQERALVTSKSLNHVNLLKVSHHGSKYSSDEEFLKTLSPDVAVVSCGKINSYGHPSKEAIQRLEQWSDRIYYTMDSGFCFSEEKQFLGAFLR